MFSVEGVFSLDRRDALLPNADGRAKRVEVNGHPLDETSDKAAAAFRSNPKVRTSRSIENTPSCADCGKLMRAVCSGPPGEQL
jgi:hypothetical protein